MSVPPEENASSRERSSAYLENWKRKLLDLTRRNRALHFRVNKVSTLTIVDEHPAEVFRRLVLREQAFRFKAAPEPEELPKDAAAVPGAAAAATNGTTGPHVEVELEDEVALQQDFVPYDPATLADRHTDEWLQTTSTPDALDKSLRRIDEQARSSLDEQGVNTLFLTLGMVNYKESKESDQLLRAPLVLVPVGLSRKGARSGFFLRAIDEDPIVNPALLEALRRQHEVELPELPDAREMEEDYDLQQFLIGVRDAISSMDGWSVTTDIYLSLFSFQKLVMYKDLDAHATTLREHRLIRRLIERDGDQLVGVPDDVRTMDLDQEFPPERTFQVVDADSSQLRAIAAVARDHDVVIEGPPGTGKSQTITNLIAQALSAGKTVLFVAEKMAALSVVHERLRRTGLAEFCLALHSTKANKRAVMQELSATLDASLQPVETPSVSTQRLPTIRAELTEYVRAVHEPFGSLGASPYRAFGELAAVLDAPRIKYDGPVDGDVTREKFDQAARDLQDLAAESKEIGAPSEHPWRDARKTFYSEDDLETVRDSAADLAKRIAALRAEAAAVREKFGLPPIATFADLDVAESIARVIARSPGVPISVLHDESWDAPPVAATELLRKGHEAANARSRIGLKYEPGVFEGDHATDVAFVQRKLESSLALLAPLSGRYRAIRRRWAALRSEGHRCSMLQQLADMQLVGRCLSLERELRDAAPRARELFGAHWKGERSAWEQLDAYVAWVVEFRGLCVRHGLKEPAFELASRRAPDVGEVVKLHAAAVESTKALAQLGEIVGWSDGYLAPAPLEEIEGRAKALAEGWRRGPQWAAFESARLVAARSIAAELVPMALRGEIAFDDLVRAFRRAFFAKWLAAAVQARPPLARFQILTHEERVAEFRELDLRVLMENRASLVSRLRDRVQSTLRRPEVAQQLPHLRREMVKQRRLNPLRRTMQNAGGAVRAIKPCWMMSPLTVAQLLEGESQAFDLVIFDEASQLPPEDAVGAILRGRQLVVVGDPKQLPPTSFFVNAGPEAPSLGEDGEPAYEDTESILEEYMGCGVPMSRLKWHYRSAHESLISFSNKRFYEADLFTFPSVERGNASCGLQFEHLPDGVYEGKGLNAIEARRVADEVVSFAKEQLARAARNERTLSLGVGTFNLRQQVAIQDELEQRRRADPSIEGFFDRDADEPFFVKNLENIQGDERDVIFLSVTYGRGVDGKLRQNFGPLNGVNGWRRLNVLTTRARQRMKVFSSMRGDEISTEGNVSQGPELLREFLLFAERGVHEPAAASPEADAESPFEREVLDVLRRKGLKVVPKVGAAGYRIDLAVIDDELPGRFVCGIECDGLSYHSAETARDRDRLRQQVLEARGWTIHRVWSTDWFKDRNGQTERLIRLIQESSVRAKSTQAEQEKERERVAAEAARLAAEEEEARRREVAELVALKPEEARYERPVAAPYALAQDDDPSPRADVTSTPIGDLVRVVVRIVETETPIHELELLARVAAMWNVRAGSKIQDRILEASGSAEHGALIQRRGTFLWSRSVPCRVRSRSGMKVAADRIAPEEYQAAVLEVLGRNHGFARGQLVTEVRALLGFSRTGAALDEAINAAIDALLASGQVGEGGTGIRRRASA